MILLVASLKDVASKNIAQKLLENYRFKEVSEKFQNNPIYVRKVRGKEVKMIFINEDSIYAQFITDFFKPELLIFLSRHSSASGTPTLSVHTPGNLGSAEFGGKPRKVSISPASAMRDALLEMARLRNEKGLKYDVSYECTHHGPSLDVPTMFVELGSSPKQWMDLEAAEVVAHAAMAAASKNSRYLTRLGIGGPHYNRKFTRMALNNEIAFGHMIPKYAIPYVDLEILKSCVERTLEKVDAAVIEWKGISGSDRGRILNMLKEIGLPIERI